MIRLAQPDDAPALLEIYAPIVRDTAISFEVVPPTETDFRARIARTLELAPWLVLDDGSLAGYAYATKFRERAAYQWTVETTVYVRDAARGRGVGRALYETLFRCLRLQGFRNAVAGITLPNEPSVRLHQRAGFRPVGTYRNVGFKFGRWHDTAWLELPLGPFDPAPAPPTPLPAILASTDWTRALST